MATYSMRLAVIVWLVLSAVACGASTTPETKVPEAVSTPTTGAAVAPSATVPPATAAATAGSATAVIPPSATARPTSPSLLATATVPGNAVAGPISIRSLTAGLQSLQSYRIKLLFTIDTKDSKGSRQAGTLEIVEVINNTARALQTSSKANGNLNNAYGANGAVSETYFLDGTTFLVDNGKCRFLSKKPFTGLAGAMILPDDYINGIVNAVLTRRGETVNAVLADHYTFATGALGRQLQGMVFTQGDVWLAADGYVVSLKGQATGKDQFGAAGSVAVDYNVDSVNQPNPIKVPADCVAP